MAAARACSPHRASATISAIRGTLALGSVASFSRISKHWRYPAAAPARSPDLQCARRLVVERRGQPLEGLGILRLGRDPPIHERQRLAVVLAGAGRVAAHRIQEHSGVVE